MTTKKKWDRYIYGLRPQKSMLDKYFHIGQFLDKYWEENMNDDDGIRTMDEKVHGLVHILLVKGEFNITEQYGIHHNNRRKHQDFILAVKNKIKPGILAIFLNKFTKQMVFDYLKHLKDEAS
jgi:hypothetical protein